MHQLQDPRQFSTTHDPETAEILSLAASSLDAQSASDSERFDSNLRVALVNLLAEQKTETLGRLMQSPPSVQVYRQLWRRLVEAWTQAERLTQGSDLHISTFALPLVIIGSAESAATLIPVLPDPSRLISIVEQSGGFGKNKNYGFSGALASAEVFEFPKIIHLLALTNESASDRDIRISHGSWDPIPLTLAPGHETVHLRFLMGSAIHNAESPLAFEPNIANWGAPLAKELIHQIQTGFENPDARDQLLVLPREPSSPLAALRIGLTAQREISSQIFASAAIRRFRASVGEPSAVISAHRCSAARHGGELRLSLSSPFDERSAEGFRCPLFPWENVEDARVSCYGLFARMPCERHTNPGRHSSRPAQFDGSHLAVQTPAKLPAERSRPITKLRRC